MTLIGLNPKKCAVCGQEGKFPVMHSYTNFENRGDIGSEGSTFRVSMGENKCKFFYYLQELWLFTVNLLVH